MLKSPVRPKQLPKIRHQPAPAARLLNNKRLIGLVLAGSLGLIGGLGLNLVNRDRSKPVPAQSALKQKTACVLLTRRGEPHS